MDDNQLTRTSGRRPPFHVGRPQNHGRFFIFHENYELNLHLNFVVIGNQKFARILKPYLVHEPSSPTEQDNLKAKCGLGST